MADARTELSDIVRTQLLPSIAITSGESGEQIFFHLVDPDASIPVIDTIAFYRTSQNSPVTYALLSEVVAEELSLADADREDLVRLGRACDAYETLRRDEMLMRAIQRGIAQGLRHHLLENACEDGARLTMEHWRKDAVATVVQRQTGTPCVDLPNILYAGGKISREEYIALTVVRNVSV